MEVNFKEIFKNLNTEEYPQILFKIFKESRFELRFVGGSIRDAILKKENLNDIDFATNAKPEKVQEILKKNNVYYFNSGLKHGTITAVFEKICYEITTLRVDEDCDGRHARVSFSESWEDDASRRDFTFNAFYMDDSGKFYDYFGGLNDLLSKTLRFIGSASERIIEDYLRILRALRFFNRYCEKGLEKKSENFDSIRKYSYKLNLISGERIASETIKIFEDSNQDKNLTNLEYFNSLNITQFVFLEDKKLTFSYLRNALDLKFLSNLSGIRKIGLVLKENSIDPLKIKKRWRISNKDYSILNKIFKFQFDIQDFFLKPKKYIYLNYEFIPEMLIIIFSKLKSEKIPINSFENFIECFEIQNLRNKELSEIFCNALNKKIEKPILPIDSKLLISLGFSGKEISNGFNEFEKIWLDKNCKEIQEINEALLKIKSSYN